MGQQESGQPPVINTEVASLVGHAIITTKKDGKEISLRLDNFGFDDWSAVQSKFASVKRSRMIRAAVDCGKELVEQTEPGTPARLEAEKDAKKLREEALLAAGNVIGITEDDFREIMSRPDGVSIFFWSMIERRYPGRLSTQDVERMISNGDIDEATQAEMIFGLQTAIGLAGNSQGQSG